MLTSLRTTVTVLGLGMVAACASDAADEAACVSGEACLEYGKVALESQGSLSFEFYTRDEAKGRISVSTTGPGLQCSDSHEDFGAGQTVRVRECSVPEGVTATLIAEPQPGYAFVFWNKCDPLGGQDDINAWNPRFVVQSLSGGSGPSCEAYFATQALRDSMYAQTFNARPQPPQPQQPQPQQPQQPVLQTVTATTVGSGTVSLSASNGSCSGNTCQVSSGTGSVTLSAMPSFLSTFVGWSGCSTSTAISLTLQGVSSAQTCTATFRSLFGF
jgi:hypothetical protein